jgi:predicted nucleic acid-binding protein
LLALDTNVFIYAFERHAQYGEPALRLFEAAEQGCCRLLTSALTLTEVLVVPLRAGRGDLVTAYRDLFAHFPRLEVVTIDDAIADAAAHLRARHGLRTPDALHLASAQVAGATAFVSEDARLKIGPVTVWGVAEAWGKLPIP